MINAEKDRKPTTKFAAYTAARFLIGAALCLVVLSLSELQEIKSANEDNSVIRIDRAGRTASALFQERVEGATVALSPDGSAKTLTLDATEKLAPSDSWDELLDAIGDINQGAANLFRFDSESQSFARLSTTFRTPDGARVGGSQVEPGIISAGHPAFASLMARTPFVGSVPVAGRLRLAYLTPIIDSDGSLTGILAVDVGWVDDLNRVNGEARQRVLITGLSLLAVLAIVCMIVMIISFRPLRRLTEVAHALGSEEQLDSVVSQGEAELLSLASRDDEVGYLAKGLTKVSELQNSLRFRAFHDDLTQLPNRLALIQELEQRFAGYSERELASRNFALLIVDVDGFKETNDGLGHEAGDELLIALAESLAGAVRPGEFLARIGGDVFAFLSAVDSTHQGKVDKVTRRLSVAASGAFGTSAGDAHVRSSIGIALSPQHGTTPERVMSHADLALYDAKRSGGSRSLVYEPALNHSFKRRVYIAGELRKALNDGGLHLEYQPIYDKSGRLSGTEALARWQHETEGAISPVEFIPIAENAGLIGQLGSWALMEACRQVSDWSELYVDVPRVSVNISTLQLDEPLFLTGLREVLNSYPAASGWLCLELTESVLLHSGDDEHHRLLAAVSEMGVKLSIDDFGTGYSSLNYLQELVVDQVKVDRSFVRSIDASSSEIEFLSNMIGLGKGVGLSVVLEGIETDGELALAKTLDCDLLQGFLLGRPMSADALADQFGIIHPKLRG